ncbi:MAG TPA: CAP domain-containing protein [Gemmatimonadales bacterium]|nr:CAP domain-containing protein [Gemmatimonadales bacterium]
MVPTHSLLRNAAKVLLGVVLGILLALSNPASADDGLTALVNAAYPARATDATLHDIAHQRAVEISTDFSHAGRREGTAEVLAWNSGSSDPVGHVVGQWQGSPDHDAILSDPTYDLIGCGSITVDGAYYAACVLMAASEPVITPAPANGTATPEPVLLPNTATR